MKPLPVRGRKRSAWGDALHHEVRDEFHRLSRIEVNLSLHTVILFEKDFLKRGDGTFDLQ